MSSCAADETRCRTRCVLLANDALNCGACGKTCPAGEVCDGSGRCAVSCPSYLVQCGSACIDPQQDREHCGTQGSCSGKDAGTSCGSGEICAAGTCTLSCQGGFVRCGDRCVDPREDRDHCGASGDCSGDNAGTLCPGGSVCSDGRCALSCQSGLLDCAGRCVDPQSDRRFCGASGDCAGDANDGGSDGTAGETCASGKVCSAGACVVSCTAGRIACGGGCIEPQTDAQYCGATAGCGGANGSAGHVCAQDQQCVNGGCKLVCPASQLACGDACVDPKTDNVHCGATADCFATNAGTQCDAGNVCNGSGKCAITCQSGLLLCGGACADPLTDRAHCGATTDCSGANAGTACKDGEVCDGSGHCKLSCQSGLVACDGTCIDPASNPDYCGAKDNCNLSNAGVQCGSDQSCSAGQCVVRCPAGQAYCGTQCIDPKTDPLHCGVSSVCGGGQTCSPNQVCDGTGACNTSCASGFVVCGGRCTPSAQCPACGNGGACNTADLGGATCTTLGLGTGVLLCNALTCRYDTSMCSLGGGGGGSGGH